MAGPFFDSVGIDNVVWLDDLFENQPPSEIDFVQELSILLQNGAPPPHAKLADLTTDDNAQEWAREIMARLSSEERAVYFQVIARENTGGGDGTTDYAPSELERVAAALGSNIQKLGLSRWASERDRLIRLAEGAVFLVDREATVNDARENVGDAIVQDLVRNGPPDVLVIVLTHSVTPETAETLRADLARDLDIAFSRVGVVSKRAGGNLEDGVRLAVRTAMTQLTCSLVASRLVGTMKASLDSTLKALQDLPVGTLDHAIFKNSFEEGASEHDLISRIFLARQKAAVDLLVADIAVIHSPLNRLRKLRAIQPLPMIAGATPEALILREWHRDEVIDSAERLNPAFAPLSCGDIFFKDGAGPKYYVLLAQPCDLAVRPNGQRSGREGVLVRMISPFPPDGEYEVHRFLEVPPVVGTDRWALDFRSWYSVNLECLEWASFNPDGKVSFTRAAQPPEGLLPGWLKRYEKTLNRLEAERPFCLSLGALPNAMTKATQNNVAFPYRRVGRLRGPIAPSALSAFASFHARAAFDLDFTKGLS